MARENLDRFGIKPSVQRMAIMEHLIEHRTHPTSEEIHSVLVKRMPMLSKTTVYNTLKLFARQGALNTLGIDEHNMRYDIDTSDHAHFFCLGCGKVYDVPREHADPWKTGREEGWTITEAHLYYKGYCKKCNEKKGVNSSETN